MTKEKAIKLLETADVFFEPDEEDGINKYVLNMNDVWGWACADGEDVPEDQLIEVGRLFFDYGWPGILYWVSVRRNNCRSEFHHYNRFIDFVANEEKIRQDFPEESKRAYHKATYTLCPDLKLEKE